MTSRHTVHSLATAIIFATPGVVVAQSARADSLLNAGGLQRAESLYYAAVQVRPRDPAARYALGRYLVSRGAPRVGATLFEEALQFGGDASLVGADLAPLYLSLGEYHKLSALKTSALSSAERERARWLVAHTTKTTAPDSVTTVPYRKPANSASLGQMTVRVNGRSVEAAIVTREHGIVISDTNALAKRLRTFRVPAEQRSGAGGVPAVADSIAFGRLSLTDYPVTVRSLPDGQQMIVGLDVLARYAPTFDPRTERISLRASGTVSRGTTIADEFATLFTRSDVRILQAPGWVGFDQPQIARVLASRRWTLDARRGLIAIER